MYPLQLHFSPGSPHVHPASPQGSPAARRAGSAQGNGTLIPPGQGEQLPQGEPAAVMAAAEDAEEAGTAALVLAVDRQSLQLQVVKTAEEAAQVGLQKAST